MMMMSMNTNEMKKKRKKSVADNRYNNSNESIFFSEMHKVIFLVVRANNLKLRTTRI